MVSTEFTKSKANQIQWKWCNENEQEKTKRFPIEINDWTDKPNPWD